MVEVPTLTLTGYDDILHYYIGAIVVGLQNVDQSLSFLLSDANVTRPPEEFMKRKELWSRAARALLEGKNTILLADLQKVETALDKVHQLRDALVHGNPRVTAWKEPILVECTLSPTRKRYRQAFVKHIHRIYRGTPSYKAVTGSVRRVANGGSYPLQISYELDEVKNAPDILRNLVFDIHDLRLKIRRCQPDFNLVPGQDIFASAECMNDPFASPDARRRRKW